MDVLKLELSMNCHEGHDLGAGNSVPLQDMLMSLRENVRGTSGQRRSGLLASVPEAYSGSLKGGQ